MSEAGFQIFNTAFPIGAELLYAACLTLFLRPFLMEHGNRKWKLPGVFLADLLISLFCDFAAAPQGTFTLLLITVLTAASKALELERAQAFLLGLLYWNAKITGALIVQSLYFIGDRLWPLSLDPPGAVYFRAAALLSLLLLSHAVLLALMLHMLQCQIRKRRLSLSWREVCYLSLIPTAGILFGQVISSLLFEVKDGVLLELYERHPAFLAAVPLLAALLYAGSYLAIAFQQGISALREEQAIYFMERQQTQTIRARIREMEQFYARIRELKHEMRGHLTNMKGLVRNGEYASLENYISQMDESISGFELALQTGNPVTDVIINDKRRRSLDLGISFQADFCFSEPGAYDAFDMGIILQNLLQNALEACEKATGDERFITLTGKRKGRFFLIEVKNSFEGKIALGSDGLPITTKKGDISMHGIGLSNVRREAEKYMGDVEISAMNQEFRVTVLLQEKQTQ